MHQGQYVFSQLIRILLRYHFDQCVEKYKGNYRVRILSCWEQFLAMALGQLGKRESLRDIMICLDAHRTKFYHLGFQSNIRRMTLRDANERRDYRIYEEFAYTVIAQARKLYISDPTFTLELDSIVYALDSTTIDLSLSLFPWAKFRKTKAGIKLHTLIDLCENIPSFIHITNANTHDVNVLKFLEYETGAFYIMDRGYLDFKALYLIHTAQSFFVTRAKSNTKMRRLYSRKIMKEEKEQGIRCDQVVVFTGYYAKKNYPEKLRRIKYYDRKTKRYYIFLTNNFLLPALTIAKLYKYRWQIELFFKWIKQNLKIKVFWGRSENAVKTQIWISITIYALIAIMKKSLSLNHSMNEILQILSISLFDKIPIRQLFQRDDYKLINPNSSKQLSIFNS